MTHNLERWLNNRKEATVIWNKEYSLCLGMKKRLEAAPLAPGTYFKIVNN